MFEYDLETELQRNQDQQNELVQRIFDLDDMKLSKKEKVAYKENNLWKIESLKITKERILKYFTI